MRLPSEKGCGRGALPGQLACTPLCASPAGVHEHHRGRRAVASAVFTLLTSAALGPQFSFIPLAAHAEEAPALGASCLSTLEPLPAIINDVSLLCIKRELKEARSKLRDLDDATWQEAAEACTRGDAGGEGAAKAAAAKKALSQLREELDYQIAKGTSDPRYVDPDDADDLNNVARKTKGAMERLVASVKAAPPA